MALYGVGKVGLFGGPLANLISTTLGYVAQQSVLAVLTVSFAPAPGTLLLLSCGVAGLALLGRKRSSP